MECIAELIGHRDDVNDCVVAPDGSVVVSASYDKTLKVWKPCLQWPVNSISPERERYRARSETDRGLNIRVPQGLRWLYGMREYITLDDIPTLTVEYPAQEQ